MQAFVNFCKTNPVRAMAIVQSLIVLGVSFGLRLNGNQITAIVGFTTIVLGLGGELVRSNVTPMATLPDHVAAAVNATMDADVPKRALAPVAAPTAVATAPQIITVNTKGA